MITFKYISEARRKEKTNNDLTDLPSNFFKELEEFFNFTDDETIKKQAQLLVKDFMQSRMIKIAQRAILFEKEDLTNLLDEEFQLYRTLKDIFNNNIEKIFSLKKGKHTLVKFNKDCDAFLGSDLKPYGPFKKEDITTIPIEQALTLKQQNIVGFVEN